MDKEVLFLTKPGVTKSCKGLIFISEKAWAPCFDNGHSMQFPITTPPPLFLVILRLGSSSLDILVTVLRLSKSASGLMDIQVTTH